MESRIEFNEILKRAAEIKATRESLQEIASDPVLLSESHRRIQSCVDSANSALAAEKHSIISMLDRVESILQSRAEAATEPIIIPEIEDLKKETTQFLSTSLPVVQTPYPQLCGASPHSADQIIPKKTFVCVPITDGDGITNYILAYLIGFNHETFEYVVVDADPEATEISQISVPANQVFPLPTSSPARRTKGTTFQPKTRVLALWPDEVTGYTTVFYPATVTSSPNNSPGIYGLMFDGTDGAPPVGAAVPERYVVQARVYE